MDELTLLRKTRNDAYNPTHSALAAGRERLMGRVAAGNPAWLAHSRGRRRLLPRVSWAASGIAAALIALTVAGNVALDAESAQASELLRAAASETTHYADLKPGSGQYLRARTRTRSLDCDVAGCKPNDQVMDVYMPADSTSEWVLRRDWGHQKGVTGKSVETLKAAGGRFYGTPWVGADYRDIPVDGAAAYAWIDRQYTGGSMSREEDDFARTIDVLRSGLVPAAQRAALLNALSRIPGVTATENIKNLDGVAGVAIGRTEPLRAGERQEIIIDPTTGMVIGERVMTGATIFGWGPDHEVSSTAVQTIVTDEAP